MNQLYKPCIGPTPPKRCGTMRLEEHTVWCFLVPHPDVVVAHVLAAIQRACPPRKKRRVVVTFLPEFGCERLILIQLRAIFC